MHFSILFVFTCLTGFSQQLPFELNNGLPKDDLNEIETDDLVIDLTDLDASAYGNPIEESDTRLLRVDLNNTNPEEIGPYLEGDILIPRPEPRSGMKKKSLRWKNGRVPYVISEDFGEDDVERINWAIEQYHTFTCIKLEPKESGDTDYIEFTNTPTGCWSSVGRIGGRQAVNLKSPSCTFRRGTIIHEIMHALGFFHEQNRPDRDDWVDIQFDNIRSGLESNFHKISSFYVTTFDVPYDYNSVMHYNAYAFSKNGEQTIVPLVEREATMGQRKQMSQLDIQKINKMYKCEGKKSRLG